MSQGLEFGSDPERYDLSRPHFDNGVEAQVMDLCVERARLRGKVAIEIGLGTGLGTEALLSRGVSIVGIEPDERMLKVAERRLEASLVESEEEFESRVEKGVPAVIIINDTFGGAVRGGKLQVPYGGVVAVTSIHWAIEECGRAQVSEMIANLLEPEGRLATIHTPIDSATEKSVRFVKDSQEFWPDEYLKDHPLRLEVGLRRAEAIPPKDFLPHLQPVSYDTWTIEEDLSIDDYLRNIGTYWEILELDEDVREQFFKEYRCLAEQKYDNRVPVGRAILLQIEEKSQTYPV